jgi:uncharacterized membrane protein
MRRSDCPEVSSAAAVVGHLIHPMLMAFSIAFLTSVLATDLAFWGTGDPFWVSASAWLLLAGVVMGAIAAAVGVREFVIMSRVRSLTVGWLHFMGNAAAMLFALSIFCIELVMMPVQEWYRLESFVRRSWLPSSSVPAGWAAKSSSGIGSA